MIMAPVVKKYRSNQLITGANQSYHPLSTFSQFFFIFYLYFYNFIVVFKHNFKTSNCNQSIVLTMN